MFKSTHDQQPAPEPEIISSVSPTTDGDEIITPIIPGSSACGFTLGSKSEEDVIPPDTSTYDPDSSIEKGTLNDGGDQSDIPTRQS